MAGMISLGELDAAADLTTAALIDNPNTDAQKAVDRRIQGIAAGIIASDPTIKAGAAAAAEQAANDLNSVRAYPETANTQATVSELPMQWVYRTLNDPYGDLYTDAYEGTWGGASPRTGSLPVLGQDGKLSSEQVPELFASIEQVRRMITAAQPDPTVSSGARRVIRSEFPIFGARLAKARLLREPAAIVIVGSSTSAANPGYVGELASMMQDTYPVDTKSPTQWSPDANFTQRNQAGVHVYSAARSGARSGDYLPPSELARVAALKPALIHHMVGANDFRDQTPVATYKANVLAALDGLDGLTTTPCQHVLCHQYQSMDVASPSIPWADYAAALEEIANSREDTVFIDISSAYISNDVPGADPLSLISGDKIHQTGAGYAFMADLIASIYLS